MVEAHPDHAYALAPSLRKADQKEIECFWPGEDHGAVLEYGVESSDQCWSLCVGDTIHGMWGHGHWCSGGPTPSGMGYVWMLTDNEIFTTHAIQITRVARKVVFPSLDKLYGSYGNFVHSANLVHSRWLMGAGFKQFNQTHVLGEPFSLYLRSKSNV